MSSFDVVVVGAGINGMVAAAELAGSGLSVCLVDDHDQIGGFIASGEVTEPGFVHDRFSSWHPLFHIGGAYADLGEDLARHGLRYCNTDGPLTAAVSERGAVVAHRDPEKTADGFTDPGDQQAYLAVLERIGGDLDAIGSLLNMELRSPAIMGPVSKLWRRGGLSRLEFWTREAAASGRSWCRRNFTGGEMDQLWVPWLLHAGLSPDAAMGGLMVPILAATMHGAGLPVVQGGAGRFVDAFAGLLAERGVEVRTGTRVDSLQRQGDRVTGVITSGGVIGARQAVLCSVTPDKLWNQLVGGQGHAEQQAEARAYQFGRGAMQVHVSLDRPIQWSDQRLEGVPLVHLSSGSDSTGIACAQASAGVLPARPTVVVGQQFLLDESRVPEGRGQLWLQLQEVPFSPVADAAGELDVNGGWDSGLVEGYVARVLGMLDEFAPGTTSAVREVVAYSPNDLAAYNPNAVQGDPYCGSAELDQYLIWRPGPHSARHRTAVPGLWHIGASTHPGPGLGGGSGHLAAQELLSAQGSRLERLRRSIRR